MYEILSVPDFFFFFFIEKIYPRRSPFVEDFFFFLIHLFIFGCAGPLSLRGPFSSSGKRGPFLAALLELLIAVVTPAASEQVSQGR